MKKPTIPMNATTRKASKALAEIADELQLIIEEKIGEKIPFTLMLFTEGRSQYISNVDRADSIEQIENMLDYWKRDLPDIKPHEIN